MKFCSNCASPVAHRVPPGDSLPRYICDHCGEIHYQNPRLVVGTIPEWQGRLLLCRRAIEPRYGLLDAACGIHGERRNRRRRRDPRDRGRSRRANRARRGVLDDLGSRVNQVHVFFRAQVLDLEFRPGAESLEVSLFEEAQVPWKDIAFRTVSLTLERWFADRGKGTFGFHVAKFRLARPERCARTAAACGMLSPAQKTINEHRPRRRSRR
jgi:ADP-ribose pyrophosphatase YjhB (NUDIX family)